MNLAPDFFAVSRTGSFSNAIGQTPELLGGLVAQAETGLFVQDLNNTYLFANSFAATLLGVDEETIAGRSDAHFFSDEACRAIHAHHESVRREGRTVRYECERGEGPAMRVLEFTKSPWREPGGHVVGSVGVLRDVTGMRSDIAETFRLTEERERERQIRERLVLGLSHDLRSPLAGARAAAQLLLRTVEASHPAYALAERIVRSMDRSDAMIRDFLDGSRIGAGEALETAKEELDLEAVIRESLESLSSVHGQRFLFRDPPASLVGFWDREALIRMLENLSSNALKYGRAKKKVTITAGLHEECKQAWFCVHNEGLPIPPEEQAGLFDLFRRAPAGKAQAKGWGVGLAIVSGLAEALGGTVGLESSAEEGTRFTVRLPLGSGY